MRSLSFSTTDRHTLSVDVFSPETPNGTAVILLHGGALLVGHKNTMHIYASALTDRGYTVFTPEYRLLSAALWPAPLDDVKAVIAYVRDHSEEFGITPDKIVLEGFSAGAMLALSAGMEPGVAAVVSFFAAMMFSPVAGAPGSLGPDISAETSALAAPIEAIFAGYPPTMILHGTEDTMVPYDHALQIFARLRDVGAKADLRLYHDHIHEFSVEPSMLRPVQNDVADFLDRAVTDPERYAEESRRTNPFLQPGPPHALPPHYRP